jgi:hypothetical protein
MRPETELKNIQHKVYMSYFQDGLWDIFLGLFLLAWGFGIFTDTAAFIGIWFVASFWSTLGIKKWITRPRVGHAKIAQERRTAIRLVIIGSVTLLAIIVILYWTYEGSMWQWTREHSMLLLGVIIALPIGAVAYWWSVNRWYAYTVFVVVGAILHTWLSAPLYLTYVIPGGFVLVCGLVILYHFLSKYPRPVKEAIDDSL